MAGDWIKFRGSLFSAPKIIALARHLHAEPRFREWMTPGGAGPANAQIASDEALRYVALSCATRVWCAAREHGTYVGDDLLLRGAQLTDIDVMAGAPCVGKCLAKVGWAIASKDGVILPKFKQHNAAMTPAERMKAVRERRAVAPESAGCAALREPRNNRATEERRGEERRGEERREEISQETQSPPASPDLFFDDSKCFPIAATFYRATGSDKENDPFPWQLAVLVANGLISMNAFCESIESLRYAKGGKGGYFRRCIERHVGGKVALRELLGRVRLTKDFPRAPPQTDQAFSFDLQSFGSESLS